MIVCQFIAYICSMNKYKDKPEINEEDLGKNPFLNSLHVDVNSIKSDSKYQVYNKAMGEDAIFELANFEFEATPYCKVYADSSRRLDMVALSPRSKDLLMWVMYEAKKNKDWLWVNKKRYMEESKVGSINTYKAALNELIKCGFITKTVIMDTFWLNPHYFFNGNRITKFPDNVKRKR